MSIGPNTGKSSASRQVHVSYHIADIRELAFHRPDLVNIEPNSDAIEREIRAGNTNIKGLHCWVETVAGVRV